MAAAIEAARPDARVELIGGGRGIFRVVAEGEPIFDKGEAQRFPEPDEVIGRLPPG